MRIRWLSGLAIGWMCASACKWKQASDRQVIASAPPPPMPSASSRPLPRAVSTAHCSPDVEYLVPPRLVEDGGPISAIVAASDQVYFQDSKHTYRVPLAGRQATVLSAAPPDSRFSESPIFVSGDRLVTQALGEPVFLGLPKSGGAWSPLIDLTRTRP